jgi:4-amino-4-deoxy-L-arabinose transferase-like glycosyltransferase
MNPPAPAGPRRDWPFILAMTALGAVVRLWGVHRLGLSHFDEGMYAMAAFWVAQPGGFAAIDPSAALYAPPLYHLLNGLSYLLLGYADLSLIATSLVAGVAAIPLSGWIARRTFGPGAGAAASALAALSGAHVAFSRMALTDSLFLATWLVAIGLGLRFLERPGIGRAIVLGLAVGLAQNTKYNGWLAGVVIAGAGLLGLVPRAGAGRRRARRLLVGLGVAAGVSALCYLPWYRFVQAHGGYDALMAHQRGYLGRPGEWPAHLRLQLGAITALGGGPLAVAAGWGLAALGAGAVLRDRRGAGIAAVAGVACALVPALAWWAGLALLPWLLRCDRPAVRALGVWWLVLSVLTPAYHPYARLWLPLHAAGWSLGGGVMVALLSRGGGVVAAAGVPVGRRPFRAWAAAVGVAAVLVAFVPRPARALAGLLAPTDFVRHVLLRADLGAAPGGTAVLKVLARPHAAFYLFLDGGDLPFQKIGTLDQLVAEAAPQALALVDEAQLRQAGDLDAARAKLAAVMEPVPGPALVETLSPVTLLDVAPQAAFGDLAARPCRWQVWRFRSTPGAGAPPR